MVSAYDLVYPPRCSYPLDYWEVYYRVFFEDGAVPTLNPATPDDPFLGRVLATSITPPHNVDSLKRCLAKHEGINYRRKTISLFLTRSSKSPMDDTSKINIVKRTGTGATPRDALALVVKLPDSVAEWDERPALVNYDSPTETRWRKKFLPCFNHFPFLISGPIGVCKSTTGCTTTMGSCHRESLPTWSNLHSGVSGSIGLHRLIQSPLSFDASRERNVPHNSSAPVFLPPYLPPLQFQCTTTFQSLLVAVQG